MRVPKDTRNCRVGFCDFDQRIVMSFYLKSWGARCSIFDDKIENLKTMNLKALAEMSCSCSMCSIRKGPNH